MDLKTIVSRYKLFIDTSTWMYLNASPFLETQLSPVLLQFGQQVKVPVRVVQEVNKFIKSEDQEKRKKAQKAAKHLENYFNRNIAKAYGSSSDPFADQTILYVFQQFRVKYDLALITQDRGLAHDILNLNNQQAVMGKRIYVFRINEASQLEEWKFNFNPSERTVQPARPRQTSVNPRKRIRPDKVFQLGTKVITQKETQMIVSKVPDTNDVVYSKLYGTLKLQKELGSGGEGKIFLSNNGKVCKIYKKDRITHERFYKLKRMLEIPIDKPGICWPKDILTNSSNEFVGYIMEMADGKPMQTSLFQKPVLAKNFPHWKRKHLVQLALSILGKIIYLHERNIIIGDINPLNILVKSEKEVYFVDTDSYQIENYPCPVGTINFTAPNLQGKNFSTFLRSFEDEYFAVNTLIFMTLLPGKPPYSQQGGGSPSENIKAMKFPYPCGQKSKGTAPDGPWKYIWSHLPFKIKEALYDTFTGERRVKPEELQKLLIEYTQLIANGYSSDDLFPTGHKIPKDKEATLICSDRQCNDKVVTVHVDFKEKIEKQGRKFICETCKQRRVNEKIMRQMGIPVTPSSNNNRENERPRVKQTTTTGPAQQPGSNATRPNQTNERSQTPSQSNDQGQPTTSLLNNFWNRIKKFNK